MENIFSPPKHSVDVVLCLDGTGSMRSCIDAMKTSARELYAEILCQIDDYQKEIESVRLKLIVFRDYREDGRTAIEESPFFSLPDGADDLAGFVERIEMSGGGDPEENGLEALYYAMRSDFHTGKRDRQVIILLTDADAHALGACRSEAGYPSDMVDEEGLIAGWEGTDPQNPTRLSRRKRRMMLFAPAYSKYQELAERLEYCRFEPIEEPAALFARESLVDLAKMICYHVFY